MTDRDEPYPAVHRDMFNAPPRSLEPPDWENLPEHTRQEIIATENIGKAHAERQAVGERARSTIERQEGESARRHDQEDREREMGERCR